MKRFNWQEMQAYWRLLGSRYSGIDWERDPEGLGIVVHAEAPLWFNRYYARFQRLAFQRLLARVPMTVMPRRALDVGCGTGRWCRLLTEHGYETVGIDLQSELIEENRRRYPQVTFLRSAIQEYEAPSQFDVVSSVTVIQHVPFEEQDRVIHQLRSFLRPGGHAIILENVQDQNTYVFSNSIDGWRKRFGQAGFHELGVQRYDYSPMLRLRAWLAERLLARLRHTEPNAADPTPAALLARWNHKADPRGTLRVLRTLDDGLRRFAVWSDSLMEPLFVSSNVALSTVHCGFLFQAR